MPDSKCDAIMGANTCNLMNTDPSGLCSVHRAMGDLVLRLRDLLNPKGARALSVTTDEISPLLDYGRRDDRRYTVTGRVVKKCARTSGRTP